MDIDWDALTTEQQDAILNGGAGMLPEGVESHLGNPPADNLMTLVVLGISLFLITLVVFIRIYAKVFCLKNVRIEDAFGLIAFGAAIAHGWSVIELARSPGLYVHAWDVRVTDVKHAVLTMNLLRTFYGLFNLFSKNAILLEWIHIFVPRPQRTIFWWLCWALIAINTMLYISHIVATNLRCVPQEKMWYPWVKGFCINLQATDITIMVFNLACDVIILILPQSTIWSLRLRRQQKIGLSFLFSLGLLTCGCAAGRVHATAVLDYVGDWIYDVPVIIIWGIGEMTFVMMVFCIPAAPKAFKSDGVGLGTRIVNSLGSWARMATGSGSAQNSKSGTLTVTTNNTYRKMEEGSQVALADLGSRHDRTPAHGGGDGRILKTTEFVTTELTPSEAGDSRAQDLDKSRRHPWG